MPKHQLFWWGGMGWDGVGVCPFSRLGGASFGLAEQTPGRHRARQHKSGESERLRDQD